ncbi:MAG: FadR family transcriptional regulator [Rhodospirillaceae bacterium]|nr:MAG: FadR family transcriptional regulator [Rhodospirillaceae bacterium]
METNGLNGMKGSDIDDQKTAEFDPGFFDSARNRADLLRVLRAALTDGTLRAGDRLPNERQIANASGLSRSTVREVLRDLDREGRVLRHVGRGTFVADMGLVSADRSAMLDVPLSPGELMEFRSVVEPSLVNLVVLNASEEQLARLVEIVEGSKHAATPQAAEAADRAFHECLFAATGNRFFMDLGRRISAVRAERAWMKLKEKSFSPEKWAVYWNEHRSISRALNDRDADLARSLLKSHLSGVRTAATLLAVGAGT